MKKQVLILITICLVSEMIAMLLHGLLAASVVALILVFILLMSKIVRVQEIKELSDLLLNNMTILFIPAAVGIIEHLDLVKPILVPLLLIVIISTIVTFMVAGMSVQWVLDIQARKK